MKDDLKDKVESDIVSYVFSMKVPAKYWDDFYVKADGFFKKFYGDVRWVGLSNLIDMVENDYKYLMLYDELESLKVKLSQLEEAPVKGVDINNKPKVFGKVEVVRNE